MDARQEHPDRAAKGVIAPQPISKPPESPASTSRTVGRRGRIVRPAGPRPGSPDEAGDEQPILGEQRFLQNGGAAAKAIEPVQCVRQDVPAARRAARKAADLGGDAERADTQILAAADRAPIASPVTAAGRARQGSPARDFRNSSPPRRAGVSSPSQASAAAREQSEAREAGASVPA